MKRLYKHQQFSVRIRLDKKMLKQDPVIRSIRKPGESVNGALIRLVKAL